MTAHRPASVRCVCHVPRSGLQLTSHSWACPGGGVGVNVCVFAVSEGGGRMLKGE